MANRVIFVNAGRAVLELRAQDGRAVLIDCGESQPCDVPLPEELAPALQEWARVVETMRRAGEWYGPAGDLASERGRRLALRLARNLGTPVRYADPISGLPEDVPVGACREPTPWATGLPISAVTAVVVGVALIALSRGLTSTGVWAVVLGNVLVAAGLAPSLWLSRATPVWRWVAYGAAAGILLTWAALLTVA